MIYIFSLQISYSNYKIVNSVQHCEKKSSSAAQATVNLSLGGESMGGETVLFEIWVNCAVCRCPFHPSPFCIFGQLLLKRTSHEIFQSKFVLPIDIEEETDRREGKGRRCCLGDVLECRTCPLSAWMMWRERKFARTSSLGGQGGLVWCKPDDHSFF